MIQTHRPEHLPSLIDMDQRVVSCQPRAPPLAKVGRSIVGVRRRGNDHDETGVIELLVADTAGRRAR
jgi:hypothetical protein